MPFFIFMVFVKLKKIINKIDDKKKTLHLN